MRTLGPTTPDPLVLAVRSALIDAVRQPPVRRQPGDLDISMGGYKHVYGDAQDLAEVAVQVLRETLADRLSDIITPSSGTVPPLAPGAAAMGISTAVVGEKDTTVAEGLRSTADGAMENRLAEFTFVETGTTDEDEETYTEAEWLRANAASFAQDDEAPEVPAAEFPAHWSAPYFASLDPCSD